MGGEGSADLLLTLTSWHTTPFVIACPASEEDWWMKVFGIVLPTMSSSGPAATAKLQGQHDASARTKVSTL